MLCILIKFDLNSNSSTHTVYITVNGCKNLNTCKHLFNFLLKTIGFDIFNLFALWLNLKRSSNVLEEHPYLPIFMYLPVMSLKLYENIFYGGMLVLGIVFQDMNELLLKIVSTTKISELQEKSKYYSIAKSCQLSDKLDELSSLHSKLIQTTEAFNSAFGSQLVIWFSLQLLILIMRCFFQYVSFVQLFLKSEAANFSSLATQNLVNIGTLVLTWMELLMSSYACEVVVTEVCR